MYAKSFMARNRAGRLTGARTALRSPSDVYTCCYCGSTLVLHAESERPWFAHTDAALTECGRRSCPCTHPDIDDVMLMRQLQRYVPNARPVVSLCRHKYHADREAVCS
ncbi:hypothetical protein YM80_004851 [Salmonella enterica subsp. salamae]|nr:hypothetical protein [Salmonella enterica]EDV0264135.1 hypothetical protein [Salmonella enterica subsp. salamae]EJC8750473.1 hypothetical protein [Salmonella enterica]HCM1650810.1 hypothetical protein [Salmonella enterica subsp. diarizonae serovar 48:i:z35]